MEIEDFLILLSLAVHLPHGAFTVLDEPESIALHHVDDVSVSDAELLEWRDSNFSNFISFCGINFLK